MKKISCEDKRVVEDKQEYINTKHILRFYQQPFASESFAIFRVTKSFAGNFLLPIVTLSPDKWLILIMACSSFHEHLLLAMSRSLYTADRMIVTCFVKCNTNSQLLLENILRPF